MSSPKISGAHPVTIVRFALSVLSQFFDSSDVAMIWELITPLSGASPLYGISRRAITFSIFSSCVRRHANELASYAAPQFSGRPRLLRLDYRRKEYIMDSTTTTRDAA